MQFCVTLERIALLCLPFGCFKAKAIYWCSKKVSVIMESSRLRYSFLLTSYMGKTVKSVLEIADNAHDSIIASHATVL